MGKRLSKLFLQTYEGHGIQKETMAFLFNISRYRSKRKEPKKVIFISLNIHHQRGLLPQRNS
jgi:hypothetical protein